MDFDIAKILANPDFQYMLAGLGAAGGKAYDNPLAQAAGGITMQGIGAQNQRKLIQALLGQGGGAKGNEAVYELGGWDRLKQIMNAHPDNKMTFDGNKMNITGDAESLNKAFGSKGAPTAPQAPIATSPSGGQQSILNPSSGLPGDLSGLSLAGLNPEDINKAISLGLSGADLERKKVSDLYQNQYRHELIREKAAARGAKDVLAPFEVPGVGPVTLDQLKAMPTGDVAYAYAMHLRKQNGQPIISPEQFKLQASPSDMEKLARVVMNDPKLFDVVKELKQAGATKIDLGTDAARQQQQQTIKHWNDLDTPSYRKSLALTETEMNRIEDRTYAETKGQKLSNTAFNQKLEDAYTEHKVRKFINHITALKGKIINKRWDPKRKLFVFEVMSPLGKKEEKTLER
jgi:hypothetical protein